MPNSSEASSAPSAPSTSQDNTKSTESINSTGSVHGDFGTTTPNESARTEATMPKVPIATRPPITQPQVTQPIATQPPAIQPTKPKLTDTIRRQIEIEINNIYQPQYDRLRTNHDKYVAEQQQKLIDIDVDYEIAKMTIEQSGANAGYKQTQLINALNARNKKIQDVKEDMDDEQKDYEKSVSALDKEVETMINRRLAEYEQ